MRSFRVEGIIIKRVNYAEADKIITILTKYHGKLSVKAGGVRKITSKRSAHIELLNHVTLSLYKGSRFPIVIEAESIQNYSEIKQDLEKVGFAFHICELIDGLCPEGQEQQQVFMLLKNTLERVKTSESIAEVIHDFEIGLLSLLGFWHGQPEVADKLDTQNFIENIIEKRLRSKNIFSKLE